MLINELKCIANFSTEKWNHNKESAVGSLLYDVVDQRKYPLFNEQEREEAERTLLTWVFPFVLIWETLTASFGYRFRYSGAVRSSAVRLLLLHCDSRSIIDPRRSSGDLAFNCLSMTSPLTVECMNNSGRNYWNRVKCRRLRREFNTVKDAMNGEDRANLLRLICQPVTLGYDPLHFPSMLHSKGSVSSVVSVGNDVKWS